MMAIRMSPLVLIYDIYRILQDVKDGKIKGITFDRYSDKTVL